METEKTMIRKFTRTNLFIIDEGLWNWAQYRSRELGKDSVAEYIFDLIKADKEANG